MNKMLLKLILITSLVIIPYISVKAEPPTYKTTYYSGSSVKYIKVKATQKISVAFTIKGYKSGINCSYFNVNTLNTVKAGDYNRPFIVIKEDNAVVLTDNKEELLNAKQTASAGSWLVKEGKIYSTKDHFSKSFKNAVVRRTCIGIDKDKNVYLVVMTKASLYRASVIMQRLGCTEALNLDGGSSTQLKYNSKFRMTGKKVANFIVVE